MGKKKQRASQTSKGEVGNPMKTSIRTPATRMINQRKAWAKGKNVVLTIPNPNTNETNKPFIRVNSWEKWGNPRKQNIRP
jgi:hypothetical protein